jgi:patatin-like phospholipase/acyl hydrolase
MKNFILTTLLSLTAIGVANAADATTPPSPPQMPAACKPIMEHMMSSHKQIEAAVKANNPTLVGNLVIAEHNYMESAIAQNPECKPQHRMQPMPPQ